MGMGKLSDISWSWLKGLNWLLEFLCWFWLCCILCMNLNMLNIICMSVFSISSDASSRAFTVLYGARNCWSNSSGASCWEHLDTAFFICTVQIFMFSSPMQLSMALFLAHLLKS